MTRLLFIGDIVGKPGRELVRRGLAALVAHHRIDLVIANGENAAAGFGITPDIAEDLFAYGVHVIIMAAVTCWLLYLQAYVINAFCQFCLISAATTFSLLILFVISKLTRSTV